jgi:hypothetical protein
VDQKKYNSYGADVRGFRYDYDRLAQKCQSELDILLASLRENNKSLAEIHAQIDNLRFNFIEHSASIKSKLHDHFDLHFHSSNMLFLVNLREKIENLNLKADLLKLEKSKLQKRCIEKKSELDGFDVHRDRMLKLYAAKQHIRIRNQEDSDWLSRLPNSQMCN